MRSLWPSVKRNVYKKPEMSRLLSIEAELSAPPSQPLPFRDLCLWASVFRGYDVVAVSEVDMIDHYNRWFRCYGLWDYVSDLLAPAEATREAISIYIAARDLRLTAHTLSATLSRL